MCNELLLNLQYKSFEKETENTAIPSVFMPKNEIAPPLVNIFSKIRMLRAGKLMLYPFLEHQSNGLLSQCCLNAVSIFFPTLVESGTQIREAAHVLMGYRLAPGSVAPWGPRLAHEGRRLLVHGYRQNGFSPIAQVLCAEGASCSATSGFKRLVFV